MPRAFPAFLLTLSLVACGSGSVVTPSTTAVKATAAIWLHPLPPGTSDPSNPPDSGSIDFLKLFASDAPWPIAVAHTQVIGLYAGWIVSIDDQDLQSLVTFLNAHNMGIEIEAPAMQALATCGTGVEGYAPYGVSLHDFTLAYLQRLKQLNAQVAYLKVDEPFYFGNVTNDPRSCNFSLTNIASQVGQYTRLVKTVYPSAQVGDVEPVFADGGYPMATAAALAQWHQTYQQVTGAAFPFFFADIDWSNPTWPALVKTLEAQTRQQGMNFGIIYIGDQTDTSDLEWTSKAYARFQAYQLTNAGTPDYVLFQSWEPHPTYCLPESDSTTFTGLIDAYIQATGTE
jgi:hypothetical protein